MRSQDKFCRRKILLALLFVGCSISACADRELLVTDFSEVIQLVADVESKKVVGLHISVRLSSGPDAVINLGCSGVIYQRIVVAASVRVEQTLDWYSNCAEVSFWKTPSVGQTMLIRYRFQEI